MYGVKYTSEFNSQLGHNFKVRILQKNYNSAITELKMGGEPVVINYNGSEEKFDIIRGSECILNFYCNYNYQFEEIVTADKNEFRIEILKDNVLYWSGYVIQDNYDEPFMPLPYQVTIRATDGLGDLKLYDFMQNNGFILADLTLIDALLLCLGKLQNATQLVTSIDVFETNVDRLNASNESLNRVYVNPFLFLKNETETLKCDEVVKIILECFNCYIYFKEGKYFIDRINYKASSNSLVTRTYNVTFNDFSSDSNVVGSRNILSSISRSGATKFINADQSITYTPTYNKAILKNDAVQPKTLLLNSFFRYWNDSTTTPNYWERIGTFAIEKVTFPRSGNALKINQIYDSWTSTSVPLTTNKLTLQKLNFTGAVGGEKLTLKLAQLGRVRLLVRTLGNVQYLTTSSSYDENGILVYDTKFQSAPTFMRFGMGVLPTNFNVEPEWYITNLETIMPTGVTGMEVSVLPTATSLGASSSMIREFNVSLDNSDVSTNKGDKYTLTSTQIAGDTFELEPKLGEFSDDNVINQMMINSTTGLTTTGFWYRDGKSENKALFEIVSRSLINQYRKPYKNFSGSIIGDFDFGCKYTIEELNGYYMPYKAVLNLKTDVSKVEFFELLNETDNSFDTYSRITNYKDGELTDYIGKQTAPVNTVRRGGRG
jgi:hypothetical protein